MQHHRHGELALEASRVTCQGHGGVDDIAHPHIRQGDGQCPAAIQHQPLKTAFAAHDDIARLDIDLDYFIAAQNADMMDGQVVIVGIERQGDIGQVAHGRQVHHLFDRAVIA